MHADTKTDKIEYEFLCRSKNGAEVIYDPVYSHAATHLEDTPQLKELAIEVLTNMNIEGEEIANFVDMGRVVGTSDVVEVGETDEIVYAMRKNRADDGYVPFTKSGDAKPCPYVSVVLKKKNSNVYELASAWIGTVGDDEPFPQAADATGKSIDYWSKHAFVWGSQEIIPGTLLDKCPW